MSTTPKPANETERLNALYRYKILDTAPEEVFNRVVALAARLFKVPIALFTLMDENRQWFKASYGVDINENTRENALCSPVIFSGKTLVVEDATKDPRFVSNPHVVNEPHLRFYAGTPLRTADGYSLGTLCLMDLQPRQLSVDEITNLEDLAAIVMKQVEIRLEALRLAEAEANLHAIFNSRLKLLVIIDAQHRLKAFNQLAIESGKRLRGQTMQVGESIEDYTSEADLPDFNRNFDRAMNGQSVSLEKNIKGQNGSDNWFEFSYEPIYSEIPNNAKKVEAVCMSILSIDARKKAELSLAQNEERFRSFLQYSTDVISVLDAEFKSLYVSPALSSILGWEPEGRIGKSYFENIHPEDLAKVKAVFSEILACPGKPISIEFRRRTFNGNWLYIEAVANNLLDKPSVAGIVINAREITQRKQTELRLQLLERAVNESSSAIVITDCLQPDNPVVFANPSFEKATGYSINEVLGRNLRFLQGEEREQSGLQELRTAIKEARGCQVILRNYRKDGSPYWNELLLSPVSDSTGKLTNFIGIQNDITQRKLIEEELKVSLERFNKIFSLTPISIAITNLEDGVYLDVNDVFLQLTGYTREEIIGQKAPDKIWPSIQQRQEFISQLTKDGFVRSMEVNLGSKDKPPEPGLFSAEIIELGGKRCILSTFLNISGYKQVEEALRQSQLQLFQSQKMEAVGQLAGGVAHDFNNLLTVIIGYVQFILLSLNENDPLYQDITEIQQAANRASALTRQLLAFSREQLLQPTVLDLNEVVDEMHRMLQRLIGENIEFCTLSASDLNRIKADRGQLEQVLVNLAVNARDAMPEGGKLTFETSNVEFNGKNNSHHPYIKQGSYIQLSVTDTGHGMSEATRSRIFEPFFTTKERGRGTGLGLSMVYGIIKQSEGYIEVLSKVGVGSTFKIYLPSISSTAGKDKMQSPNLQTSLSLASVKQETVLVVEDEEAVRNLTGRILEQYGYRVLMTSNGNEALVLCKQNHEQIDLLLTDVVLPKLSGPALAKRLVQLKPGIKVLYMSGYTDGLLNEAEGILSQTELNQKLIQKPFTPQELATKIREALGT